MDLVEMREESKGDDCDHGFMCQNISLMTTA